MSDASEGRARARSSAAVAALLALALSGLLQACDDDEPPGADPSSSADPTDSGPTDPSSSDATTTAPAEGPPLDLPTLTLNAPEGWEAKFGNRLSQSAFEPNGSGGVYVYDTSGFSSDTLDSFAGDKLKFLKRHNGLDVQRLENREIDGVECYVIQGSGTEFEAYYEFGAIVEGSTGVREVEVEFQWPKSPPSDVSAVVEPVIASVQWK